MYVSLSKLSIVDPSKLTKGQANDSQPLSCSLATLLIFFHSSPFMLLSFINSRGYVILYSPIILPFTRGLLNLFSFIYLLTIAYFINTPGLILASEDDLDYGLKIVKLQYFSLSAKFYNNTLY